MALCEVEQGFVVVDYVLHQTAGSGTGPTTIVAGLKARGIKARSVRTKAPAVSAIVVPELLEAKAKDYLRDFFYCEQEDPDRCRACGYHFDECDCSSDDEESY